MEDLKPCPFCGSDDIRVCAFEISPECYIECCNCGARIDAEIPWGDSDIQEHDNACLKALRKLWNRRSAAPAADVAPVVHGRWEPYQVECGNPFSALEGMLIDVLRCSKCHAYFDVGEALNYCPNCGCKMREGNDGTK